MRSMASARTLLFLASILTPCVAEDVLRVYPPEVQIHGAGSGQKIVGIVTRSDGTTLDVSSQGTISFEPANIAAVETGVIHGIADGATKLRFAWEGLSAEIPVNIGGTGQNAAIGFRQDVIPIITRSGCNSGTCHGSSRGQDGFRMSLFGFDPGGDYARITREIAARRINLANPEESLFVHKAIGAVPHTGGKRIEPESPHYRRLLQWLREGAQDDPAAPAVAKIELFPPEAVLKGLGAAQPFIVVAHYADGTRRDVTDLTVFLSRDDSVATIAGTGVATAIKRGESFITARFDVHTVGVPLLVLPEDCQPVELETAGNEIDALIAKKHLKLRLRPGPVCSDEVFLRRVTLDTNGRLPTREEYESFLADAAPDKRARKIEALLARPEVADLWAAEWAELLMIRELPNVMSDKGVERYFAWLREQFLINRPLDQMARELLTAGGDTFAQPAANYYAVEGDRLKLSENAAQVFLGIRLQCAQCHNHPFDRWTMNDYYGFAAFFAQVYRKPHEDYRQWTIYPGGGEINHPVGGAVVPPKLLGAEAPDMTGKDRRAVVADWVVSPDNPYFARTLANRVWARYFGRGIVEPVDDVRVSNPPSNPELYDALGARLIASGYDLRRLASDILMSLAYQRAVARPGEEADERNFTHASVRRIPAISLLDCLSQVTGSYDKFRGLPLGSSAALTRNHAPESYFLQAFGRSQRGTVCACETKTDPTLSQALHLINGDAVHGKIQRGGLIKKRLEEGKGAEEILNEIYITCLGRKPSGEESSKLLALVASSESPQAGLEDTFWAVLNSREFLFNH